MAALEGRYDYKTAEPALQRGWDESGIYRFDPQRTGPYYAVDTPPPTVSGRIHVGHVYSYTHADIMIRYHRMKGEQVFYPFGFDDNGLPTEIFTENSAGIRARDVGRKAFIEACLSLTRQVEEQFERFWKRLGLSVDWRLVYSTIDDRSRRVSQAAFLHLLEGGNVYRQESPTLWCTTCQTGVAQADVEDKPGVASLFTTIPFALEGAPGGASGSSGGATSEILIATTRPELLAACVAVFVHPDDARYRDAVGRTARTPIFGLPVPILADPRADPEKGTGAVMCCTFGDVTDVAWWRDHKLPLRLAITEDGRMNDLAGPYAGLTVRQARKQVLQDLAGAGLVRAQQPIEHTVGVHERGGHDLEFLVTRQWFIKLLEHRQRWIDAGRRIRWHPEHMRARYENWIEGLNWDWNISRQRYYGVPFPVWYCRACDAPIAASAAQLPVDPQESAPPVATCPRCGGADFVPDPDVMDTWATSSVSPQLCGTLLEPHGTSPAEFDRRYRPMTLRPNAHDIIRTWDFYTIVRSLYLSGDVPWTDVLISGHALDPSGKKISKSKLSVAEDPTSMLEQFSADAVRYWAASVRTGGDTNLSEEVFRNGNKLVTKLWNASKFALSHLGGASLPLPEPPPQQLNATDRWLLARLHEVIRRATAAMEDYEFAIAKAETERFFWTDLCDNYLELVKLRLYGDSPNASGARYVLSQALPAVLKLLAPFLPHITDAIYTQGVAPGAASIHVSPWPQAPASWDDPAARGAGGAILQVVDAARRWKAERQLSVGAPLGALHISAPPEHLPALQSALLDLQGVTQAGQVQLEPAPAGTPISIEIADALPAT
ncbi:MAG TPA: valine--tRNA ligase [Chloroflexota bacterium]|nr:valine--tRNA ligase [Chloroflexota bacterium]